MELTHLEEFVLVSRLLNFSEAAHELHLAQPTLSKHIKMLEEEIGAKLIDRSSNKVELTEEGFYFLGIAIGVVESIKRSKEQIALMTSRKPLRIEGCFEDPSIASIVSIASSALEDRGYPPVTFNRSERTPPPSLLLEGHIDLIIDTLPFLDAVPAGMEVHELFDRPLVLIVREGHPLANRQSLSFGDLSDVPLVHLMRGQFQPSWDKIEQLCERHGFAPQRVILPVGSIAEAITSIPKNAGLVWPETCQESKLLGKSPHFRCIPFHDPKESFSVCALYRSSETIKVAPFIDELDKATYLVAETESISQARRIHATSKM